MLSENAIQRAVFQHLRSRGAPGVFAFHPANGGFRRPIEAKILKGCGVLAGVPDIIALHNGNFYAIELKAMKGRPTVAQLECIDAIRNAGGHAVVCHGLDEALRVLESWGLLQGALQGRAA